MQRTGGDAVRWGAQEHLLASVVDELRIIDWHYVSSHSRKRVPSPPMIPRPGVRTPSEPVMSVAEFAAQVSGGSMTI